MMVTAKGRPSFQEMLAQSRAQLAERKAAAQALATKGRSHRFTHPDGVRKILVGPDMSKPGTYRMTYFEGTLPTGHIEFSSQQEALEQALRERYRPS